MGTGNLTGKKRQGRDERKEWLCSGRRMRKEMGMKGVSFYIFAALANKHRAMKQPVTAQGPEYTLATDDDVKIRRVSPYKRVNKEPNNPRLCAASMCIPRGSHATATRHLSLSPRRFGGYRGGYCRRPLCGGRRTASLFLSTPFGDEFST